MSRRAHFIKLFLSMLILSSAFTAAHAQWKKIGQLPPGEKIACGFFWSPTKGLVGTGRGPWAQFAKGIPKIYYTDNGTKWLPSQVPASAQQMQGRISAIKMVDALNGYAALFFESQFEFSPLWSTSDGGKSWSEVPIQSNILHDLHIAPDKTVLRVGQGLTDIQGTTIGQLSPSLLVTTGSGSRATGSFSYSWDGGVTWNRSSPVGIWSYGVYGSSTWNLYFAAPEEEDPGFGPLVSFDSGVTWKKFGAFPGTFCPTGHLDGGTDAVYVQSAPKPYSPFSQSTSAAKGFCRTTDKGKTWIDVGGPLNFWDTRFCVVGCRGAIVVGFDTSAGIWLTETGGDGTLREDSAHPLFADLSISVEANLCDSAYANLTVWNDHCDSLIIESISVETEDEHLLSSGAFAFKYLPAPNRTFKTDAVDSISFYWHPRLVTDHDTTYLLHLRVRYYSGIQNTQLDTVIIITLRALAVKNGYALSTRNVQLGSTSLCFFADTNVSISNHSCDTIFITNSVLSNTADFTLTGSLNNIAVPPGQTILIPFRYHPQTIGSNSTFLNLSIRLHGQTTVESIYIEGAGTEGDGKLSFEPRVFDFTSLSICGKDSGSGFITNIGCKDLSLNLLEIFSGGDYSIPPQSLLTISPGDTVYYMVYLNPQQKGIRLGHIFLMTSTQSGTQLDSIPVTVRILDGTRILSSSISAIDFGETTLCEERDTAITLRNLGCDSLIVTSADLAGLGFSLDASTLPWVLLPGDSGTVPINTIVDTTGGATSNTATIAFGTNADNTIPPIQLTRTFSFVSSKTYDVRLAMSADDGTAADFVTLQLLAGDWWKQDPAMAGVTRLDFDLTMNTDLLDYVKWSGVNNVTFNGSHVTLEGNPITAPGGVLAEFTYRVHLTKDSITDILLSNLTLNNGIVLPCDSKVITGTGTSFSYRYVCGDRTIQKFLQTGNALDITSIRPNPARDEVTIEIASELKEAVTVEIYDALGKLVQSSSGQTGVLVVPVRALSEGSYVVRVVQGSEATSRQFVIER